MQTRTAFPAGAPPGTPIGAIFQYVARGETGSTIASSERKLRIFTQCAFPAAMVHEINPAKFDAEVTHSELPVLVDFFSEQCTPCRRMLPLIVEVAEERAGTLKVVKFDAGKEPEFASRFRVTSIPNFVLFRNGLPVGQRIGQCSKNELVTWLDSMQL